jgi:hypothetical protein
LLRLFGTQKRVIVFIKIFRCLLVTYYLVATVLRICICSPPSAFWRIPQGKCLNIFAISVADSVISVVTDGAILSLPLILARSSPTSKMRNVMVAGILVVGGLITLTNVYRTVLLFKEGRSVDFIDVSIRLFLTGYVSPPLSFVFSRTSKRERPKKQIAFSGKFLIRVQQRRNLHRIHLHIPSARRRLDLETSRFSLVASG